MMDSSNDFERDSTDRLLESLSPPPHNDELRQSLLVQTTRIVRRRRRFRQLAFTLALIGCYCAGVVTTWGTLGRASGFAPKQLAESRSDQAVQQPGEHLVTSIEARLRPPVKSSENDFAADEAELIAEASSGRGAPAALLERWAAGMSNDARAAMFRRAGERYVEQHGDLRSAIRCFSQSLDASSDEALAVSTNSDHWLIMALKLGRQKETHHVDDDG